MRKQRDDAGFGPKAQARGQELQRLMMLPALDWPTDLFGGARSIESLMSDTTAKIGKVVKTDHLCECGCGLAHNHAVSRVTGSDSPYGYTRKISWYRTLDHRNRHMGLIK